MFEELPVADADVLAASAAMDANRARLIDQAQSALVNNRDFLALPSPTNAQTLAQVKALTRQMNAAIRLLVGDLSGID